MVKGSVRVMNTRAFLRGSLFLLTVAFVAAPPRSQAAAPPGNHHARARRAGVKVASPPTEQAGAPQGFAPADLTSAYNVDTSHAVTTTVAVVVAYNDSTVESDLATYRTQFNLPACTIATGCLTVVNQSGHTTPLPGPSPASDDWTGETALGLQMVSATCPSCKLLLVEADDDAGDGLDVAQATAANLGALAIVDNFGFVESTTTLTEDAYYDLPGVSIFAAAGLGYDQSESNGGPAFPATSEHVIGVSGTNLRKGASGTRQWTETVNKYSGSDCSTTIPTPSFQQQLATSCTHRASADVAAVGDPDTGVAIYNTNDGGWNVYGTGAAGVVAGIMAQVGRAGVGPAFFYANATALYDITSGSDDTCGNVLCVARTGWDGPSGNGSPNGQALTATPVPDAGAPEDGGEVGGAGGNRASGAAGASASGAAGANSSGAAGASGAAGTTGAAGTAGTAGASGAAGAPIAAGTAGHAATGAGGSSVAGAGGGTSSGSSGCGCHVGAGAGITDLSGALLAAVAVGAGALRRRRARDRFHPRDGR